MLDNKFRSIGIFLTIILFSNSMIAQFRTDTTVYVTPEEEAFMIDKETRGLLKFNPFDIGLPSFAESKQFDIGYEQKIGSVFSLYPNLKLDLDDDLGGVTAYGLSLEGRYYYQMAKRIEAKEQANNLTGNYLGAFYSRRFINANLDLPYADKYFFYGIKLGQQNRFLNYGYLDNSITLAHYSYDLPFSDLNGSIVSVSRKSFVLSSDVEVGFGFGKNYKINDNAMCPILKCNTDRSSAWKYNVRRIWAISYAYYEDNFSESSFSIYFNPNISYESKVNNSPFTINHDIEMNLTFSNLGFAPQRTAFDLKYYNFTYRPSLRYYFLQKKNVRTGKSGNNLSGVYVASRGSYSFFNQVEFANSGPIVEIKDFKNHVVSGQLLLGYQKEVLNNIFIDIDLGLSHSFYNHRPDFDNTLDVVSELKVGIMLDRLTPRSKIFRFF